MTHHHTKENTMTAPAINDVDALFQGGGSPTLTKDMTPGEVREGIVITAPLAQQATKFQSSELDFFSNGDPKMQIKFEVSTELQTDAEDTGDRTVYVKTWGSQSRAFEEAVRAAGHTKVSEAITPGTVVRVTYKGKQTVKTRNGSSFEENGYEYEIVPAAQPGQATPTAQQAPVVQQSPAAPVQAAPAAAPAPAPAPAAPAAPAPAAPGNPADMIAAGWTDEQITAAVPGLTGEVVAWLRTQQA